MNQIKRAYVLLAITLVIILLTASAVLAAYGPKKAPSGSGSSGSSSSSDGGSSGGGGGGGGVSGCVTGYTLVNKACVKNEVSAVAGETPSETPTGAAAEQPAALEVPEQPAEQELSEVKPASNLVWLLPFAVIALLAIAAALYRYYKHR